MGNRIDVVYTKFTNLDDNGSELDSTYGFRIYDDYANVYSNSFTSFDEVKRELNEDTVVDVMESFNEFRGSHIYPIYLNDVPVNNTGEEE